MDLSMQQTSMIYLKNHILNWNNLAIKRPRRSKTCAYSIVEREIDSVDYSLLTYQVFSTP